ncbi:MAG TPA: hypothetical protein VF381_03275 [Thermoanaerobaculia bacterium]
MKEDIVKKVRLVTPIIFSIFVATSVFAADPTGDWAPRVRALKGPSNPLIVIADVAHGKALIPEGTPFPAGVKITVQRQQREASILDRPGFRGDLAAATEAPVRLTFAYAPDSEFDAARQVIARGNAVSSARRAHTFDTAYSSSEIIFYVYFPDIGYIEQLLFAISYAYTGAQLYIYVPSGGELASTTPWGTQSSNLPGDPFSAGCATSGTNSSGALCVSAEMDVSAVSATVTDYGDIQGRTFDGCGIHEQAQCNVSYQATITTYYYWFQSNAMDYSSGQ